MIIEPMKRDESVEIEDSRKSPFPIPNNERYPEDLPSHRGPSFKINTNIDFEERVSFHGGPSARRRGHQLAAWSALASAIDVLIMISASCIFLLTFSWIVQAPVGVFLKSFFGGHTPYLFFIVVFVALTWVYGIFARSLVGFTLGEWTCDLRLGQPHERMQALYIFRVIFRSTLVLLTGGIVLPGLSLFLGKDVAGSLSGLRLFSLK